MRLFKASMQTRRWRRRLGADRSGATAVEFAFVAPLMLLLVLGIIELGIVYMADASLRMTTNNIAREVRTGQIQTQNLSKTQFRTAFCAELPSFMQCNSALELDVEAFNDFNAANYQPATLANGSLNLALNNYNPGVACQVVLVRAFYQWPVQNPVFLPFLVNLSGNAHLIAAAAAFRNEPFSANVSGC